MQKQHYTDVIMGSIASQITSLTIVYSTVYSDADQRKHQSSASLAFVWEPVNSPHKWPVTRGMFPFDDVIMRQFLDNTHYINAMWMFHFKFCSRKERVFRWFVYRLSMVFMRFHIEMTDHVRQSDSNYWQYGCLFNKMFRLSPKN